MISQICRNVTNSAYKHYNWEDHQRKMYKRKASEEERIQIDLIKKYEGYDSDTLLIMEKEIEEDLKSSLRFILLEGKYKNKREFVQNVAERLRKFGGIKGIERFVKEVLNEEELNKVLIEINRRI